MSGAIVITGPRTDRARIAPLPDWVIHAPYDAPAEPEEVFVSGGRCAVLDDTQVDLTGPERQWHARYVERVMTNAGAERAAQFSAPFDPNYETIHVHHVRVIRGGEVFDHARPDAFDLFRRERSLERLVFDGKLTLHLVIPDVRVGDLVETCYTIIGANPILKGKHAAWIAFEWGQAMLETRHRVITRADRDVLFQTVNDPPFCEIIERDGLIDRRWRAVRRPAVEIDDLAPPWFVGRAEIQFSQYRSWAEIADIYTPLYAPDPDVPDEIIDAVRAIGERFPDPADQAVEILRFVQSHLRYLALSIGEGSLQPRPVATVWRSRYGDCKDAARLYVEMARRLGIDACPALVNTRSGEALADWIPTGSAFDHCIVRVETTGRVGWFDPTRRRQSGRFDRVFQPFFGYALPLRPGQDALEPMGPVTIECAIDVRETVRFGPKPSSPASYEWRTTLGSWRADDLRERIANEGVATLGKHYLKQVQESWPGAFQIEPLVVEDDPDENRITTIERYEITTPWRRVDDRRVEFSTRDWFANADLVDITNARHRTADIHLGRRRITQRRLELHLPADWKTPEQSIDLVQPSLRYASRLDTKGKRHIIQTQLLEIASETMPARDGRHYAEIIAQLRKTGELTVSFWTRGDRFVKRRSWLSFG